MAFASERQRRYVMSLMDKIKDETSGLKDKSRSPLSFDPRSDSKESHDAEYDKLIGKFEEEYRKVQDDAKKDVERSMSNFSEKRGSVPLLPNTYVIRGSNPKQRQKVKRALDMIGDELPMKEVNTVLLSPEQDIPLAFMDEKTISLSERFLSGSDGEIAKTILSAVYRRIHPEEPEGSELAFASEVVEPKVREKMRRDLEERNMKNLEVHQVGSEVQPQYETERNEEQSGGVSIRIVPPEIEKPVEEPLMGVPVTDAKEMNRMMKEQFDSSIYGGGVK